MRPIYCVLSIETSFTVTRLSDYNFTDHLILAECHTVTTLIYNNKVTTYTVTQSDTIHTNQQTVTHVVIQTDRQTDRQTETTKQTSN